MQWLHQHASRNPNMERNSESECNKTFGNLLSFAMEAHPFVRTACFVHLLYPPAEFILHAG